MKRLVELPPDDALTARAHVLVRTLGPTVESEARLQRVRRSLDAPRAGAMPRWVGRGALVAALVGVSAAAIAATGGLQALMTPAPVASVASPAVVPSSRPRPKPVAVEAKPAPPAIELPAPALPAPPASAPRPANGASATEMSDIARVHEAAKALRRDRDSARALQLLEGRPIAGPLAEEALALRIEASLARGDGRAGRLASAYLARYPRGRYRDVASRALAGRAP